MRLTLDTKPMAVAVKTAHLPIPTQEELRHDFDDSDRYSVLDMNHAFFQFPTDKETSQLYVFYTPWGLHKFDTLAMGVSSASAETHERIRRILEGVEGTAQIKDDLIVHGKGKQHDERLITVLQRLEEHGITLNILKCKLGQPQVKWFGFIFSKQGMSKDPEKVESIMAWKSPTSKSEVKSFLQTVAFCAPFMKHDNGETYADVTAPLRKLTNHAVNFKWTEACEKSFNTIKKIMSSNNVLANFDPNRKTRVYVDHGPLGLGATLAQLYEIEEEPKEAWRPVKYASRALVDSERNYAKIEGESLSILFGIKIHKEYLYGSSFEVVTDHKPLVSLYNNHSKNLPERVGRHKSKLQSFVFTVKYEPGHSNPADFGSRHPETLREITPESKESAGIEDEEEDEEIVIAKLLEMEDAITLEILQNHIQEDEALQEVISRIKKQDQRSQKLTLRETKVSKR